jgi:N-acyl-D-amino-acid deacylase
MPFDVLVRGGLLVDGTGAPGRPGDLGVAGDRIVAVGDLAAVDLLGVDEVLDAHGLVVAPGFVDVHSHSDLSVLVDGAQWSHLRQGFTTQLDGNCGYTFAPLTHLSRQQLAPDLEAHGVEPWWSTFAGYLDAVETQALGINSAHLVGHGTIRAAVLGASDRAPDADEIAEMLSWAEEAMRAGALGISTGLIYPPGIHAGADEVAALVAVAARYGGLYATHVRNEAEAVEAAIDEALATARAAERLAGHPVRLQVSHLKAGGRSQWGLGPALVERLERARRAGLDVAADQYPYTAAHTQLSTYLPPEILALEMDRLVTALRDPAVRDRIRDVQARGIPGWENPARDPGWENTVIAFAPSRRAWHGRSLAAIAAAEGADPLDLCCDVLADDRLAVDIVQHCMDEGDLEAIMAVPWIAVCTDGESRRAGHPVLGRGVPHPRSYGTTARVLGRYVRERGVLSLEAAVAKLASVPAERLGLRDRGVLREGWAADLVVFDPETIADVATWAEPAVHPAGIRHVIVNGRLAVRDGEETGVHAGRLLRRGA